MRLLFVTFQHPWPPDIGGRQRRFHIARELSRKHDVTLVSLLPCEAGRREEWKEVAGRHFNQVIETDCRQWLPSDVTEQSRLQERVSNVGRLVSPLPRVVQNWQSHGIINFFRELRKKVSYDVAWIDRSYIAMAAHRTGFDSLVVDVDEVLTVGAQRNAAFRTDVGRPVWRKWDLLKTARFERRLPHMVWRLVVCKEEDRAFFNGSRDNIYVVPNGIGEGLPATLDGVAEGQLLFVGAMDYFPNEDAAMWFAGSILPSVLQQEPHISFDIVGQHPRACVTALHDGKRIRVHGRVPDVLPHYQSAEIVVAPIRLGSGTRLKVLEALSNGKALVATSAAVEGIGLRPGLDFEKADSASQFTEACVRLLRDSTSRLRLGESGRRRVLERFQWNSVGRMAEVAVSLDA